MESEGEGESERWRGGVDRGIQEIYIYQNLNPASISPVDISLQISFVFSHCVSNKFLSVALT